MISNWVNRTSRRPTRLSVRYHGRRVFIGRLCRGLFVRTCIWNVSRGAMHRSWQTWTAVHIVRMKRAKLLLQKFSQSATDYFLYERKGVLGLFTWQSAEQSQWQTVGTFERRKLAFSSVRALHGLPLPGRLLTVSVSRNFLNSLLTPLFVQLFSGNSSVNLFAVCPFKYKLCTKILSSSLNIMLIVDKHCSDASAVTNFQCHKLIAKVNK